MTAAARTARRRTRRRTRRGRGSPSRGARTASAARENRGSHGPPPSGTGSPAIAATHTSSVNTSRSHISAALASSPSNHTAYVPGPQRTLQLLLRQRRRHLQQLAHAIEVMADHPIRRGPTRTSASPAGAAPPAGGSGCRSVPSARSRRRTRSAALQRTGERARERRHRSVPGTHGRVRYRSRPSAQLPRRPLEQQPPPQRHRRLPRRRSQQPVEVIAREVGARGQRRPVDRLVERRDHDIDQFPETVRHVRTC